MSKLTSAQATSLLNVRSYSLNGNLGFDVSSGADTWRSTDGDYAQFKKLGTIKNPTKIITFIDEHLVIMNDGNFVLRPDGSSPMQPGLWKVHVEWTAAGQTYAADQKVVVPAPR